MIFTFTKADFGMDKIFHGKDLYSWDIESWESRIPGPSFDHALLYDSKLVDEFFKSKVGALTEIANKYLYNTVSAARLTIGKIAQTAGFLQKEFINISNTFVTPTGQVNFYEIFNLANAVINSQAFQNGLNALGAVPIVGWIIQIIVRLAESIYRLVDAINKAKSENLDKILRTQNSIPLSEWSKDVDEEITKQLLKHVQNYDVEYAFTPRNYFEDLADFEVMREKRESNQRITDFFQIRSNNDIFGAGFIPGTTFLTSHIRLPTWYGGSGLLNKATALGNIFDAGEFLPTVRNICNQLYQVIQKEGPSLYTVRPEFLSNLWENNIQSLLEYNEESIKLGWSAYPTGCSPEIEDCIGDEPYYDCSEEITGKEFNNAPSALANKYCSKKGDIGKKIKQFAGQGHYLAMRQYIADLYFDGSFKDKNGKILSRNANLKDIDISKSIPIKTLATLKERQKAVIDSLNCAYISLDVPENRPRFTGLYNNPYLKQKWEKNLNLILKSHEWKKLNWRDIVDEEFKNEVAQRAKSENLEYNKEGPILGPQNYFKMGPDVLPNPKIPPPTVPVGIKEMQLSPGTTLKPKTSSASNSIAPIGIGLGALAYMFMKK